MKYYAESSLQYWMPHSQKYHIFKKVNGQFGLLPITIALLCISKHGRCCLAPWFHGAIGQPFTWYCTPLYTSASVVSSLIFCYCWAANEGLCYLPLPSKLPGLLPACETWFHQVTRSPKSKSHRRILVSALPAWAFLLLLKSGDVFDHRSSSLHRASSTLHGFIVNDCGQLFAASDCR